MSVSKLFRVLPFVVLIVVGLLLVQPDTALAAPLPPTFTFTLAPDGTTSACIDSLCLTNEEATLLGIAVPDLSLYRQTAQGYGVKQLVIAKDGQSIAIGLNGKTVASGSTTDPGLAGLAGLFFPQKPDLGSGLIGKSLTVAFRFDDGEVVLPSPIKALATPVNLVEASAVVSKEGKVLSVAGQRPAALNLTDQLAPAIVAWLQALSAENLDLVYSGNALALSVNGTEWANLALDLDTLNEFGAPLLPGMEQYLALGGSWAKDTQVALHLTVGDQPDTTPPTLAVDRPLVIKMGGDGTVSVEGMTVAKLDIQTASLLQKVPLALTFDGANNQIRWGGSRSLLIAKPTTLIKLGKLLAPSVQLDWDWLGNFLGRSNVTLIFEPEGTTAPAPAPAAVAAPALGLVAVEIPVVYNHEAVALWGERVPADPASLTPYLAAYSPWLQHVSTLEVGSNNLTVVFDGDPIVLQLDQPTRAALVDMAVGTVAGMLKLPPSTSNQTASRVVNTLLDNTNGGQLRISLTHTTEPIPPGIVEGLVGLFRQ